MLRIEYPSEGKMCRLGHGVLSSIQNDSLPVLDILVREVLQNSLDAACDGKTFVEVSFLSGNFESKQLNKELEGVQSALDSRLGKTSQFLVIRDYNTVGLTGSIRCDNSKLQSDDHFARLVYCLDREKNIEGAGGSWGIGKTVYYRVGIGLVLFYSRVKNQNGRYESRLAASFIEDERKENRIIPNATGIAWWGDRTPYSKEETQAVTNELQIKKILDVFGISEYSDKQTGTTIIIPYINEIDLLKSSNVLGIDDDQDGLIMRDVPYWQKSIDDYLKIAIQRWYALRLGNQSYPHGAFLKANVNDVKVKLDPVFKLIQSLYNTALTAMGFEGLNVADCEGFSISTKKITAYKLCENELLGVLAYAKVSTAQMKMFEYGNKRSPLEYIGKMRDGEESHPPIVAYARKPGMIISYDTSGEWTRGIPDTPSDEFLISLFVLNSENKIQQDLVKKVDTFSLERYIQKTERADHFSWEDAEMRNFLKQRLCVVERIQKKVRDALKSFDSANESASGKQQISGLGRYLSKYFLPKIGFGSAPSNQDDSNSKHVDDGIGDSLSGLNGSGGLKGCKGCGRKKIKCNLFVDSENVIYSADGMTVDVYVSGQILQIGLSVDIKTAQEEIPFKSWIEDMGLKGPFEISSVEVYQKKDDAYISVQKLNALTPKYGRDKISVVIEEKNVVFIKGEDSQEKDLKLSIHLKIFSRDVLPVFNKIGG